MLVGEQIRFLDLERLFRLELAPLGAAGEHVDLVGDIVADRIAHREQLWIPVDVGHLIVGEARLEAGLLVEQVGDQLRVSVTLEGDRDPHIDAPLLPRLVGDIGDPVDL